MIRVVISRMISDDSVPRMSSPHASKKTRYQAVRHISSGHDPNQTRMSREFSSAQKVFEQAQISTMLHHMSLQHRCSVKSYAFRSADFLLERSMGLFALSLKKSVLREKDQCVGMANP